MTTELDKKAEAYVESLTRVEPARFHRSDISYAYYCGYQEAQKWIAVSEQPCPIDVRVMMWFTTIGEPKGPDGVTIGKASAYELGQFWDDSGMYRPLERVTHWQNLPKPPDVKS